VCKRFSCSDPSALDTFWPIRPADEIYNAKYNIAEEDSEFMFQSQIFVSDRKNIEVVVSSTCFLSSAGRRSRRSQACSGSDNEGDVRVLR
jgi:hypothetical protein